METTYSFHAFTEADILRLSELFKRYREVNPCRPQTDGHIYLSPAFEHGQYVLCADSADGRLAACAALYPQGDLTWANILIDPAPSQEPWALRGSLFNWLVNLAQQLGHSRLAFQRYPDETDSAAFLQSKGAKLAYNIYNLERPLDLPIRSIDAPEGFEICPLRMQNEAEQRIYLSAYNECFPEAPLTLEAWQYLVYSPWWAQGVCMTGQTKGHLAGSVAVFWEPGSLSGYTEYVFTRPEFRGRGLARALLAESLLYLKNHGLERALLEVKAENESALKLYREMGYRLAGESEVWIYEGQA